MAKEILATKQGILDRARRRGERACAQLEKLYDKAADDEDARIAAVVAQKQAQKDAEEAAKAAARAAMNKAINEHRLADLERHRYTVPTYSCWGERHRSCMLQAIVSQE